VYELLCKGPTRLQGSSVCPVEKVRELFEHFFEFLPGLVHGVPSRCSTFSKAFVLSGVMPARAAAPRPGLGVLDSACGKGCQDPKDLLSANFSEQLRRLCQVLSKYLSLLLGEMEVLCSQLDYSLFDGLPKLSSYLFAFAGPVLFPFEICLNVA